MDVLTSVFLLCPSSEQHQEFNTSDVSGLSEGTMLRTGEPDYSNLHEQDFDEEQLQHGIWHFSGRMARQPK